MTNNDIENQVRTAGCRATDCSTPTTGFMCDTHWPMVPVALRDPITAGLTATVQGTAVDPAFSDIAAAAIRAVDHSAARSKPPRPRTPSRPIQLTLFDAST